MQLVQTQCPHCMLAPTTSMILGFTTREMSLLPTRLCGWRRTAPIRTPLTRRHPFLKFPLYSLFRAKGGRKTIKIFSHYHGLIPGTNYKYLECFVMLGTHSEPCKGQIVHVCDISALRVLINNVCIINTSRNTLIFCTAMNTIHHLFVPFFT